jgi:hypothetical protein
MQLQSDTISTAHDSVAVSADGKQVYTIPYTTGFEDMTVRNLGTAWDLSTAGTPFTFNLAIAQPAYYARSLYISPDGSHLAIGSLQNNVGAYYLLTPNKTITWPDNLTWEGNTTPEMPLLDHSKVFDIYTTDGGTTYQGVERISAAYNLSSLIE